MKILFINPSLRGGIKGSHLSLPVGLGYVMTYVKKHGYNFQFIDENESGEYDDGEIYAVSCEESNISNNKTVAYNGWAFDLDFVDFWMEAYDFDWDSDDENGPDFSITFDV